MKTEIFDEKYKNIENLPSERILALMLDAQEGAVRAIRLALPVMAEAAEAAAARLEEGEGRIVYIGAGTPARLAVQDGTELTPTYGWHGSRLLFMVAGGTDALIKAIEGAEDDITAAESEVVKCNIGSNDVCVAVSASGITPYTVAACKAAREAGALTIGISSNEGSPLLEAAEHGIMLDSGPEPVGGSTRMNAGTAQKVCLNMISTLVMMKLGRVYDGMMVDVELNNEKLKRRAGRIVAEITGCTPEQGLEAVNYAEGNVKLAILSMKGIELEEGRRLLDENRGHLGRTIEKLG